MSKFGSEQLMTLSHCIDTKPFICQKGKNKELKSFSILKQILKLSDQILNPELQTYLPEVYGLWPLNQDLGSFDVSSTLTSTRDHSLGFSRYWTPANLLGSPIFGQTDSYLVIEFGDALDGISGITILMWIKITDASLNFPLLVCTIHKSYRLVFFKKNEGT